MTDSKRDAEYTMGRSSEETERLIRQSEMYGPMTRGLLRKAGLGTGMKVLDIGSGAGDVALAAAEIVGPEGRVVGVDVNGAILEVARARAQAAGWSNIAFREGDARTLDVGSDFDAVVGRFILMYLSDPAEALRSFAGRLKPGGVAAFHEIDFTFLGAARSAEETSLAEKLIDWVVEVFRRSGAHVDMGLALYRTFLDAALAPPLLEGFMLGGAWGGDGTYQYVADTLRSVGPLLEQYGIASADEEDLETLPARIRQEVAETGVPLVLPLNMTAWARLQTGG